MSKSSVVLVLVSIISVFHMSCSNERFDVENDRVLKDIMFHDIHKIMNERKPTTIEESHLIEYFGSEFEIVPTYSDEGINEFLLKNDEFQLSLSVHKYRDSIVIFKVKELKYQFYDRTYTESLDAFFMPLKDRMCFVGFRRGDYGLDELMQHHFSCLVLLDKQFNVKSYFHHNGSNWLDSKMEGFMFKVDSNKSYLTESYSDSDYLNQSLSTAVGQLSKANLENAVFVGYTNRYHYELPFWYNYDPIRYYDWTQL